jgi:hypothetical protein
VSYIHRHRLVDVGHGGAVGPIVSQGRSWGPMDGTYFGVGVGMSEPPQADRSTKVNIIAMVFIVVLSTSFGDQLVNRGLVGLPRWREAYAAAAIR